jgi:nitroreductase
VQNWRWVAVTDSRRRTAIAGIHQAANEEYAEGQVELLPDGPPRRRMASALHLIRRMQEVPVHVLVYALDPELEGLDAKDVPPALLYGSVFPAVWSFQLALRARGLGTAPLYVADQAAVNDVVGAPQSAHIACMLPVAFFTGSSFQPARRRPVDEVLSWDRWNWTDPPAGAVSQAGTGWRSRHDLR